MRGVHVWVMNGTRAQRTNYNLYIRTAVRVFGAQSIPRPRSQMVPDIRSHRSAAVLPRVLTFYPSLALGLCLPAGAHRHFTAFENIFETLSTFTPAV